MKIEARMPFDRGTKNKWRFKEVRAEPEVGKPYEMLTVETMYLPKTLLGPVPPRELKVTVEWEPAT